MFADGQRFVVRRAGNRRAINVSERAAIVYPTSRLLRVDKYYLPY